ncbi:bifunctional riboflavin kinase/FAD synthetase [Paenibacillus antri]|uniref:Riboflavin biosynthesis protein n=1 Tax=Paenibacillus antri TaxID=2582848 RepID=A0A5R9G767_9BACL|nr:bifunctional riboflavin kinase/FAD synthetase [Paenibacillus antri]TLS52247.1 bifunctional riboflavin kinase/FAD synthetase [Paenibacillus antri]
MNIVNLEYPVPARVLESVPAEGQSMAIGDFDGVHLGHREVIGRAVSAARRRGLAASVMTFHPHPREVLGAKAYSTSITPLDRKLERFRELGLDTVYVVSFTPTLAALSPEAFVDEVLVPLRVKSVTVGFNFTFGHRGLGTSALLKQLGEGRFDAEIVQPFRIEDERVSSTLIREALALGDVERVQNLLGRPFDVSGDVVTGDGRGRTIGVPTANLSIDARSVKPANGVYAVNATIETGPSAGQTYAGVMNVGMKPTFHSALPVATWEVHLFDFDGDLYGHRLTVSFVSRIRDERKFDSVTALIEQIGRDMQEAKRRIGAQA